MTKHALIIGFVLACVAAFSWQVYQKNRYVEKYNQVCIVRDSLQASLELSEKEAAVRQREAEKKADEISKSLQKAKEQINEIRQHQDACYTAPLPAGIRRVLQGADRQGIR